MYAHVCVPMCLKLERCACTCIHPHSIYTCNSRYVCLCVCICSCMHGAYKPTWFHVHTNQKSSFSNFPAVLCLYQYLWGLLLKCFLHVSIRTYVCTHAFIVHAVCMYACMHVCMYVGPKSLLGGTNTAVYHYLLFFMMCICIIM